MPKEQGLKETTTGKPAEGPAWLEPMTFFRSRITLEKTDQSIEVVVIDPDTATQAVQKLAKIGGGVRNAMEMVSKAGEHFGEVLAQVESQVTGEVLEDLWSVIDEVLVRCIAAWSLRNPYHVVPGRSAKYQPEASLPVPHTLGDYKERRELYQYVPIPVIGRVFAALVHQAKNLG